MSRRRLAWLAILLVALPCRGEWHVPEATVRFTYQLSERPTHTSAGYVVQLPDGGVLPRPFPLTRVVTSSGAPLKSYTLWQNPASGMGIVFEAPTSGNTVHIYVGASKQLNTWSPQTGLTPSAILCANPDRGDMGTAIALANFGSVGSNVHYEQAPPHRRAPLCIQGDLSGRPKPCSFYMLTYLDVTRPGDTWIAPLTLTGSSEVHVDGTPIVPRKRIDKWGGTGQYVTLSKGLHRFDIFSACGGSGSFAAGKGVLWMTWAPANASINELGGPRPTDAPHAGTSKWASRIVNKDEIVRSGRARLTGLGSRDGAPLAVVQLRPTHTYWLEGEAPLLRYELTAVTAGNPKSTRYTWSFGGQQQHEGPSLPWLFAGGRDNHVILTATAGQQQSRTTRTFFGYSTVRTSLEDAASRDAFQSACLAMINATPPGMDPTATWNNSLWNNFFRTLPPAGNKALLAALFTKHWDALKDSVAPDRLAALEDRFIMVAPTIDPTAAAKWILRFEQAAEGSRKSMLQIKRAEVLAYYLDNTEAARNLLVPLVHEKGEVREWARIRLGDVDLLAGQLNEATALYGDVQNRFSISQATDGAAQQRPTLTHRLARTSAEFKAQREALRSPHLPEPAAVSAGPTDTIEAWKVQAVLEASASETVRTYLDQGATYEAYEVLTLWERQFPMSKISGELMVLEAKLYMALKQYRRARRLLETYCKEIDVSSYLPAALNQLLDCMIEMNEPNASLKAFCEEAKKRLEFHPTSKRFDYWIQRTDDQMKDDGTRAPTVDTL